MSRRRHWIWISIGTALVLLCCGSTGAVGLSALLSKQNAQMNMAGCGSASTINLNGNLKPAGGLSAEQTRNAAAIISAGQQMGVPPRGWIIAIATAMQESNLHVLANPAVPESMSLPHQGVDQDHDSVGLFQQRPNWGPTRELMDPVASSKKFYTKMLQVPNWQTRPLTDVAQVVQVSAFPDAYAKWENPATQAVNALTNGAGRSALLAAAGPMQCAGAGQIAASGWTAPVLAEIVSGFRTPDRPTHDGVDLSVPKGTPIHAAAGGIVVTVLCNASTNNCDVDGSADVLGCGWYVEIKHASNLTTRYCHQVRRPLVSVGQTVAAGQIIGYSGSSGNSSGPHLHYEVHTGYPATSANAIDPVPFMQQRGAPLGKTS